MDWRKALPPRPGPDRCDAEDEPVVCAHGIDVAEDICSDCMVLLERQLEEDERMILADDAVVIYLHSSVTDAEVEEFRTVGVVDPAKIIRISDHRGAGGG